MRSIILTITATSLLKTVAVPAPGIESTPLSGGAKLKLATNKALVRIQPSSLDAIPSIACIRVNKIGAASSSKSPLSARESLPIPEYLEPTIYAYPQFREFCQNTEVKEAFRNLYKTFKLNLNLPENPALWNSMCEVLLLTKFCVPLDSKFSDTEDFSRAKFQQSFDALAKHKKEGVFPLTHIRLAHISLVKLPHDAIAAIAKYCKLESIFLFHIKKGCTISMKKLLEMEAPKLRELRVEGCWCSKLLLPSATNFPLLESFRFPLNNLEGGAKVSEKEVEELLKTKLPPYLHRVQLCTEKDSYFASPDEIRGGLRKLKPEAILEFETAAPGSAKARKTPPQTPKTP